VAVRQRIAGSGPLANEPFIERRVARPQSRFAPALPAGWGPDYLYGLVLRTDPPPLRRLIARRPTISIPAALRP